MHLVNAQWAAAPSPPPLRGWLASAWLPQSLKLGVHKIKSTY